MGGVLGYRVQLRPLLPTPKHFLSVRHCVSLYIAIDLIVRMTKQLPLFQQLYCTDITRNFLYYIGKSEARGKHCR